MGNRRLLSSPGICPWQWDEDKAWRYVSQLLASQLRVMLQFRNLVCFSKSMEVQCRKLPSVPSNGSPHSCVPDIYAIYSHPYRPEANLCPILLYSFLSAPIALKMQGQSQTTKQLWYIELLPNLLKLQLYRLNTSPNLDKSSHFKWLLQSTEIPCFLHIRPFFDEASLLWSLLCSCGLCFYWVCATVVYRPNVLVTKWVT